MSPLSEMHLIWPKIGTDSKASRVPLALDSTMLQVLLNYLAISKSVFGKWLMLFDECMDSSSFQHKGAAECMKGKKEK